MSISLFIITVLLHLCPLTSATPVDVGHHVKHDGASGRLDRKRSQLRHKSIPRQKKEDNDPYLNLAQRGLTHSMQSMSYPMSYSMQYCTFCPDGIPNPDLVLTIDYDGATCEKANTLAGWLPSSQAMCESIQLAQKLCCPGTMAFNTQAFTGFSTEVEDTAQATAVPQTSTPENVSQVATADSTAIATSTDSGLSNLCSCSPRTFNINLSLSPSCSVSDLDNNDGIEFTLCGFVSFRGDEVEEDAFPGITIIDVQFIEFGSDDSLTVINQVDKVVSLKDGDTVSFESISKYLDPGSPLEDQTDILPGGVVITFRGRYNSTISDGNGTAVEEEILNQRLSWSYTNECNNGLPVEDGNEIGWIVFDNLEPASTDFCPVAPAPTITPSPSPTTTTETNSTAKTTEATTTTTTTTSTTTTIITSTVDPPIDHPTHFPTYSPTEIFTKVPTERPSLTPPPYYTDAPMLRPTTQPVEIHTAVPTKRPTILTEHPTSTNPTSNPAENPTGKPTDISIGNPTEHPTKDLNSDPTLSPTLSPTQYPTQDPIQNPTMNPNPHPINHPVHQPSLSPTSYQPTEYPTERPTDHPIHDYIHYPTSYQLVPYREGIYYDDFELFENMGCRTSTGESGSKWVDYDIFEDMPRDTCDRMCLSFGQECSGYEYSSHDKRCQVWKVPIGEIRLEYNHGSHCYIRAFDVDTDPTQHSYYKPAPNQYKQRRKEFELFQHMGCRTRNGKGSKLTGEYGPFPRMPRDTCERMCLSYGHECFGFEYSSSRERCEVWTVPIEEVELEYVYGS